LVQLSPVNPPSQGGTLARQPPRRRRPNLPTPYSTKPHLTKRWTLEWTSRRWDGTGRQRQALYGPGHRLRRDGDGRSV
jgi:hypothetical protein